MLNFSFFNFIFYRAKVLKFCTLYLHSLSSLTFNIISFLSICHPNAFSWPHHFDWFTFSPSHLSYYRLIHIPSMYFLNFSISLYQAPHIPTFYHSHFFLHSIYIHVILPNPKSFSCSHLLKYLHSLWLTFSYPTFCLMSAPILLTCWYFYISPSHLIKFKFCLMSSSSPRYS